MSQNAILLPTTGTVSGLQMTQDINNALDTLNTLNSGASAPTVTEPYMFWADTGTGVLWMRKSDNSAWIPVGNLDANNLGLCQIAGSTVTGDTAFMANLYLHQSSATAPGAGNTSVGGNAHKDGSNGTILYLSNATEYSLSMNNNSNGEVTKLFRSGSQVGSISVTTTGAAFNTSSDYRLKENLAPLTGAVARLNTIGTYRGNFKETPQIMQDLLLAHEVQAAIPDAVTGQKDAVNQDGQPLYQQVDHSKIVPLLLAAIKELTARVAALEAHPPAS